MRKAFAAALNALALAACATAPAETSAQGSAPEATIPFADFGGVQSFRPGDDNTLLLEGRGNRWYRATFFSPCREVRWAQTIGIISDRMGSVDRFSGILVDGRQCRFRSLVEIPDPDAQEAPQSSH
ncbi:MAG: DUF6491 family protein [Hyphomonadaceae bacterium]